MFLRFSHILSLFLILGMPAHAQAPPDAIPLLHAWLASQADAFGHTTGFVITERADRTADSPYGSHKMQVETEVSGKLGSDAWERRILSVRVNGKEAPKKRWEAMERAWHSSMMPAFVRMAQALSLPANRLKGLLPTGRVVEDQVDGVACWRFDAIPRSSRRPMERVTFWFGQGDGRLVRTSAVFSSQSGHHEPVSTLVATLDYQRDSGIDIPQKRHLVGTRQIVRRGSVFTVQVTLDAAYSDFRIIAD